MQFTFFLFLLSLLIVLSLICLMLFNKLLCLFWPILTYNRAFNRFDYKSLVITTDLYVRFLLNNINYWSWDSWLRSFFQGILWDALDKVTLIDWVLNKRVCLRILKRFLSVSLTIFFLFSWFLVFTLIISIIFCIHFFGCALRLSFLLNLRGLEV